MTAEPNNSRMDEVRSSVRRLYPSLVIISCLVNVLLLVSAIYMLQVYDRVLSSGSLDTLLWLTVIALGALAFYGVFDHIRRKILGRAGYWVEAELAEPVLRKSMTDRLAGTEPKAGLRDVGALRAYLSGDAALAFLDAPWTPIFIAFIWLLHPALGVLALVSAITLFLFALANDMLTRNRQKSINAELRKNEQRAEQYVVNGETISPLGMADAVLGRWKAHQDKTRQDYQELKEKTSGILSASRTLRLALQVLMLGTGAYYVLQGALTPGGMIAASIILGRALAPIERSISAWQGFVAARLATGRLRDLLGSSRQVSADAVKLPRPKGLLQVDGLYCQAPGADEWIIEGATFEIAPGESLAIIGPSGAGKSTLCRLLVGAWKPERGHVRLDGADVSTWNSSDLGQYIGYLPQQVELFPGTVADNIARMREAEEGQIVQAAKYAGVHELILRLPNGYETEVGVHGARISGGQRQRLGLARALFGDPAFVVLDEPSSNLDQDGETALQEAIDRIKKQGNTVVIVSHRPAGIRSADKVLILRDGAVSAFGPRDEVLNLKSQVPARKTVRVIRPDFSNTAAAE